MKTLPISSELEAKLKNSDPEIQIFIEALDSEISKLQKQKGKLEANNISLNARINILEEELNQINPLREQLRGLSPEILMKIVKSLDNSIQDSKSPIKE